MLVHRSPAILRPRGAFGGKHAYAFATMLFLAIVLAGRNGMADENRISGQSSKKQSRKRKIGPNGKRSRNPIRTLVKAFVRYAKKNRRTPAGVPERVSATMRDTLARHRPQSLPHDIRAISHPDIAVPLHQRELFTGAWPDAVGRRREREVGVHDIAALVQIVTSDLYKIGRLRPLV